MNKFKQIFICFSAIAIIALPAKNLFALGLGPYIALDGGDSKIDGLSSPGTLGFGLGFMLDTCIAEKKLFNYRFHLDYTYYFLNTSLHRITSNHAFGFGVYKSEKLRVWLGPQIGFGYVNGDVSTEYYSMGNVYAGIVIGTNIHLTKLITLGVETGYNYGTMFTISTEEESTETKKQINFNFDRSYPYHEAFLKVAVIFRLGDDLYVK